MNYFFYGEKAMHANRLQMGPTFRDKVTDRVKRFNRRHKRLQVFGMLYAMVVLTVYECGIHFGRNIKRYTCFASMMFFFVMSSSFSYPEALTLNVSFVSENEGEEVSTDYYTSESFGEIAPESDAVLAETVEIDPEVVIETDKISEDEVLTDEVYSLEDFDVQEDDTSDVEAEVITNDSLEDSSDFEFDADDWKLILVNKQHPIPDDYTFPLGNINASMHCDERVIGPLKTMLKAASDDGVSLVICSPYRDLERQEGLFARKIDYYMNAGYSYMDAYNYSSQAVTVPGSSEHQIGLAFDIVTGNYSSLDEGFSDTAAGRWLAENSYKYGFCLRYLKGKENITGIEFEPWHFRYVGVEAATEMYENGLCLEEFWDIYMYD